MPEPVWRGAMSGVGPLVEFDDVVVPPEPEPEVVLEAGVLEGGGLELETVRVARTAPDEEYEGWVTAWWDGRVVARTGFAFAVDACFAGLRARGRELLADELLAAATEPVCFPLAVGVPCGRPCTTATAEPTASAPPSAPIIAHDSESRRRGSDGASQRRVARGKPSSAAQNATPPYRLAATYRSVCPAALNSRAEGHASRPAQKCTSSDRMRSFVQWRRDEFGSRTRT